MASSQGIGLVSSAYKSGLPAVGRVVVQHFGRYTTADGLNEEGRRETAMIEKAAEVLGKTFDQLILWIQRRDQIERSQFEEEFQEEFRLQNARIDRLPKDDLCRAYLKMVDLRETLRGKFGSARIELR